MDWNHTSAPLITASAEFGAIRNIVLHTFGVGSWKKLAAGEVEVRKVASKKLRKLKNLAKLKVGEVVSWQVQESLKWENWAAEHWKICESNSQLLQL